MRVEKHTDNQEQYTGASRLFTAAVLHLEERLEAIRQEIGNYPAPIPACDLQFNTLLAERDQATAELRRLTEVQASGASPDEREKIAKAVVSQSSFFPPGWPDAK